MLRVENRVTPEGFCREIRLCDLVLTQMTFKKAWNSLVQTGDDMSGSEHKCRCRTLNGAWNGTQRGKCCEQGGVRTKFHCLAQCGSRWAVLRRLSSLAHRFHFDSDRRRNERDESWLINTYCDQNLYRNPLSSLAVCLLRRCNAIVDRVRPTIAQCGGLGATDCASPVTQRSTGA